LAFGLGLALLCALVTNASFLLRHRGAVAVAPVDGRHPIRSARGLFSSKWWTIGWAAAVAAWLLHVGAISLVPLSVAQAVIAGGLVFLAVLAERFFGFRLGRRQWIGLAVTAAGLAVLGLTSGRGARGAHASLVGLIGLEAAVFALSVVVVTCWLGVPRIRAAQGVALGVAAGALFGVSDISLKFLTHVAGAGVLAAFASPWAFAALAASVLAFFTSARSLQLGPALAVIALTSVSANLIAIVGGILVFRESIGTGAAGIVARVLAFCLVIAGAAVMPAPIRAHVRHARPRHAQPARSPA